jgi:hypothetical protein
LNYASRKPHSKPRCVPCWKKLTEKRSLNDEEGKQFDELRAQADALEVEITRLEAVADDQRNLPVLLLKVKV